MREEAQGRPARRGTTLVEVLIACLILAILAIGGTAAITRGRIDLTSRDYARAAAEAAASRLDRLTYGLDAASVAALVGTTRIDRITVNGVPNMTVKTTVSDAGAGADHCLRIVVAVQSRPRSSEFVELQTLRTH